MPLSDTYRSRAPIAVLDSGVGGIGVLREVKKQLPNEDLLYFGDSANAPYGERPRRELELLLAAHAARLLDRAKALVLACNTATAVAATVLRQAYPQTPIIGMEPALKPALAAGDHPRVLVLATATTLREEKFRALVARFSGQAEILPLAAPGLVRLVEAGGGDSPECEAYLRQILAPFGGIRPDAVVLGCTHFPFAIPAIRRIFGADLPIFDGAAGTAKELKRRLTAADLLSPVTRRGKAFLTSSAPEKLSLYRTLWHATGQI